MALRASSPDADLEAAVSGGEDSDAGVEHGAAIRAFAHRVLDRADAGRERTALRRAVGDPGMQDVAAVIAFFDAINRVADATGTQLDEQVAARSTLDLSWMRG